MTTYCLGEIWRFRHLRSADEALLSAIAAATETAKTAKQAECEASQSGPKGIAQKGDA